MTLRNAAWVKSLGLALGLGAALASARALHGALWGVTTTDPRSYGASCLLVALIALAAALPARRAASVDPLTVLDGDSLRETPAGILP